MSDTFAAWLARKRAQRKMTLDAVGKAVGVSYAAVSQWESGTTKPHRLRMHLLDDLFGVARGTVAKKLERAS